MRPFNVHSIIAVAMLAGAACASPAPEQAAVASIARRSTESVYTVRDTVVAAVYDASGVAASVQQATVSTKLMGSVTEVLVREGSAVAAGQPLVRIDARDLVAKSAQVASSVAEAEAVQRESEKQAVRLRALYADSAATRAQLDAAETGLARADAAVAAARAAGSELEAMASYAVVRAPFAGIITKRFVDPGAFASPGAPLVSIQDMSRLRISAGVTPDVARGLRQGQTIDATIEGRSTAAVIEGVVPASTGNLYTVNAIVANGGGSHMAGSAATLFIATGRRTVLVVPRSAIVRRGDLTGVSLVNDTGVEVRWVRLGPTIGGMVEVTAGLRAGDRVLIVAEPAAAERS